MVAAREHSFTSRSPQWPMKLRNKKGLLNILFCKISWIRWSVANLYLHPWLWAWRSGLIPVPFFVPPPLNLRTLNLKICRFSAEDIQLSAFPKQPKLYKINGDLNVLKLHGHSCTLLLQPTRWKYFPSHQWFSDYISCHGVFLETSY